MANLLSNKAIALFLGWLVVGCADTDLPTLEAHPRPRIIDARFSGYAIRRGGEVWTWSPARRVGTVTDAIEVATAMNIPPCVLRADRTVACLVDGDFVAVPGLRDVAQISAGSQATCARRVNGSVSCWGRPLGASEMEPPVDTPTAVPDLTDAVDLSMGWDHACVIRRGGSVACWGAMYGGQLGDGTTVASRTPVVARGVPDAVLLAAGPMHVCAVRATGAIVCWGTHARSLIGAPETTPQPIVLPAVSGIADLKSGYASTCALTTGGAVLCRGANSYGQLGDGTRVDRATPVAVAGLDDAIAIAPGTLLTCALRRSLAVVCWGYTFGTGDGHETIQGLP